MGSGQMKKQRVPMQKIRVLEAIYLAAFGLLAITVIGVPIFVHRGFSMTNRLVIEQDLVEALFIAFLLAVAYALSRRYKATLKSHREEINRLGMNNDGLMGRLTEAFKYIGKVNVELQEIRSVVFHLGRLPESRREFKNLLTEFSRNVMTIVNSEWVMIRIVNRRSLNTIVEHLEVRDRDAAVRPQIGNAALVEGEPATDWAMVRCEKENIDIIVACIFPQDKLGHLEKILVEAITGEIALLFIILTAGQYREAVSKSDSSLWTRDHAEKK
jgi:hypothetical protein